MPRTTMNSQNSFSNSEMLNNVQTPVVATNPTTPSTNRQNVNTTNKPTSTAVNSNMAQNQNANAPMSINLTERQFSDLIGSLQVRQDIKATFSSCSARFNGGRSTSKVEDFIATILVFKEAERISDSMEF